MIVLILLIVALFLWLLTLLPIPSPPGPFVWATAWLAWIVAVLLTVSIYVHGGMALR